MPEVTHCTEDENWGKISSLKNQNQNYNSNVSLRLRFNIKHGK